MDTLDTQTNPSLSDEQLQAGWPAAAKLVATLEGIGARDPSQGVQEVVAALVAYFRTPD